MMNPGALPWVVIPANNTFVSITAWSVCWVAMPPLEHGPRSHHRGPHSGSDTTDVRPTRFPRPLMHDQNAPLAAEAVVGRRHGAAAFPQPLLSAAPSELVGL